MASAAQWKLVFSGGGPGPVGVGDSVSSALQSSLFFVEHNPDIGEQDRAALVEDRERTEHAEKTAKTEHGRLCETSKTVRRLSVVCRALAATCFICIDVNALGNKHSEGTRGYQEVKL